MESPSRDIVQDDDISRSVQHWSMFRGSESFPPGSLYLGVPLSPFDSRSSDLNPLSAPLFGLDDNQSDLIGGSRLENASLVADSTRKRPKKPDPEPIPPVPSPVPPPTNPICGTSPEGFGPFAPLSAREDFTPCFEGSVLATIPRAGLVCFVIVVGLGRICSGTRRNRSQSYGDDDENDIVVVRTRDSALWWAKMVRQLKDWRPVLSTLANQLSFSHRSRLSCCLRFGLPLLPTLSFSKALGPTRTNYWTLSAVPLSPFS